jgi:WD40 repeat protein
MTLPTPPGVTWDLETHSCPVALDVGPLVGVVAAGEGSIVVFDTEFGELLSTATADEGLLDLAVAPDGHLAVVVGAFGASVRDLFDPESRVDLASGWSSSAAWDTSGRVAVCAGRRVAVCKAGGQTLWRSDPLPSTTTSCTWLGSSGRLAVSAYGAVHVFDGDQGDVVATYGCRGSVLRVACDPNAGWLAAGTQDGLLHVWNIGGTVALFMEGYPFKISKLAFNASGRFLAHDGAPELSVWDFSGNGPRGRSPILCAPADLATVREFAWHPTEDVLAIGWDNGSVETIRIHEDAVGPSLVHGHRIAFGLQSISVLTWTGDGSALIVGDQAGRVQRLDLTDDVGDAWTVTPSNAVASNSASSVVCRLGRQPGARGVTDLSEDELAAVIDGTTMGLAFDESGLPGHLRDDWEFVLAEVDRLYRPDSSRWKDLRFRCC